MSQTANKTQLRPLGNRVLARRLEAAEEAKGGILLPDTAKKKEETLEIIACGPGKKDKEGKLMPMPVTEGQKVLAEKYSGTDVTLNDEEYVILRADDIIAIIEE